MIKISSDWTWKELVLVDSVTDINYINQRLIKELDWNQSDEEIELIEFIDETVWTLYDMHITDLVLTDSQNETQTYHHFFVIIEMKSLRLILDLNWLEKINFQIDWWEKIW